MSGNALATQQWSNRAKTSSLFPARVPLQDHQGIELAAEPLTIEIAGDNELAIRKKRERQEEAGINSPAPDRRHRRLGAGLQHSDLLESACKSPISHPVDELLTETGSSPNRRVPKGVFRGDPSGGFVLKPLHSLETNQEIPQSTVLAPKLSKKGSPKAKTSPKKAASSLGRKPEKAPNRQPQVPHSRLSFGEELDEEEAEPDSTFNLAQSTADRFHNERELRLPSGNSLASPFSAFGAVEVANGHHKKSLGPIIFGVAQARGPRPYMEDRYTIVSSYAPLSFSSRPMPDDISRSFAAVYDGHNGTKAAEHACSRLHMVLAQEPALRTCTGEVGSGVLPWARHDLGSREAQEAADMGRAVKRAFNVVDDEILDRARAEQGRDGATALVVLRVGEVLWAAHAGDSRAVLCRDGNAVRLTQDHKPDILAEKARVEAAGGKVDFQRCWRVICPARKGRPASGLAVSRSFGDLDFKEPSRFVECEPDVTRLRTTHEDSFVVMASDGLWDVISDQEAVTIVQACLAKSSLRGDSKAVLDVRVKEAAEELMEHAGNKGSMDNITVLILLFQWH